jgi:hypothetical protein
VIHPLGEGVVLAVQHGVGTQDMSQEAAIELLGSRRKQQIRLIMNAEIALVQHGTLDGL